MSRPVLAETKWPAAKAKNPVPATGACDTKPVVVVLVRRVVVVKVGRGQVVRVVVPRVIFRVEADFVIVQIPRLEPGDKLDQQTFHARYEAMPPSTRVQFLISR